MMKLVSRISGPSGGVLNRQVPSGIRRMRRRTAHPDTLSTSSTRKVECHVTFKPATMDSS